MKNGEKRLGIRRLIPVRFLQDIVIARISSVMLSRSCVNQDVVEMVNGDLGQRNLRKSYSKQIPPNGGICLRYEYLDKLLFIYAIIREFGLVW